MPESPEQFALYSSPSGVKTVSNPVRKRILYELAEGERSFEDLVRLTEKAKSTVSVHLDRLEQAGLIASREDPEDRRKKLFHLTSNFIGSSDEPVKQMRNVLSSNMGDSIGNPLPFIRSLFHLMRYYLESSGINSEPALRAAGRDVGQTVAENMEAEDLEDLLGEVAGFWEEHHLGRVSIRSTSPITIQVDECFDCGGMPDVGRTLCSLDEGMIEGIIKHRLGVEARVMEIECNGTGYDHCAFEIHPQRE